MRIFEVTHNTHKGNQITQTLIEIAPDKYITAIIADGEIIELGQKDITVKNEISFSILGKRKLTKIFGSEKLINPIPEEDMKLYEAKTYSEE